MLLWWRGAAGIGARGAHPPGPVAADRVAPVDPEPAGGVQHAEAASHALHRCLAQVRNGDNVAIAGRQAGAVTECPAAPSSERACAPRTSVTA
jgi:hypothetical protein